MRIPVDGLPYPVIVSDAAPADAAAIARAACKAAIVVSDSNVARRGDEIAQALRTAGCDVLAVMHIDAGERRKNWKSVSDLHAGFIAAGAERSSTIVAVGGGTLTDVVGFAAATYLRGVSWLPVATTVLGMVDAAIGGKTAVDRPEGKNLIGAFWQPVGVVADLEALATLPPAQRKTGVAEIIKAAIVGDASLLDRIERFDVENAPAAWAQVVAQAAAVKAAVVAIDLQDRGMRATLNLGHTFAHAIEHASRYRISHGAAVAIGLRAAGMLARECTGWSHADHRRVLRALRRAGLRVRLGGVPAQSIVDSMRLDKKRSDGVLRFVLPVRIGEVRAGLEASEGAVRDVLAGLEAVPLRGAW